MTKLEILFISFLCVLCVFALRFFSFFLLWMWVWFAVFFLPLFISCFTLNILHTKRVVLVAFISLLEHFLIVRNRYDTVCYVFGHTRVTHTLTHSHTLLKKRLMMVHDFVYFIIIFNLVVVRDRDLVLLVILRMFRKRAHLPRKVLRRAP